MARIITTIRMDEALREAVEARARVERRSVSNLIEVLVAEGLGEVDRRDTFSPSQSVLGDVGGGCPHERFHRAGVRCKTCGG
jgi:hypothetical protein